MSITFEKLSTMQGTPGSSRLRYGPWQPFADNAQRVVYEDFLRDGKVVYTRVKTMEYRKPIEARKVYAEMKHKRAVRTPH